VVIWQGRGIVVAITIAVCLLASDWLSGQHFHDANYYASHGWPKLVGFLAAAAIVWGLSFRRAEESIGTEEVTPREPFLADRDSLFFIPARYWPMILCALGVAFLFVRD
jgi:hypothetical protein